MNIFIEISVIIVIASLMAGFMKLLKQPIIIGYILTGLVAGPFALNFIKSTETFETFSQFGVALLLFIVGLHLSPKSLKETGNKSIMAGFLQIFVTFLLGLIILVILGFDLTESLYLGFSLAFSSTIIVLKLVTDKGDVDKLYSKIAIAFLLLQDITASILLIVVNIPKEAALDMTFWGILILKLTGLIVFMVVAFKYLLPKLTEMFSTSQEFLFLFSLAWGMGVASLFSFAGFSVEIGALIAGVVLSMYAYKHEISSKMKPLRDFFLVIFFILLGSRVNLPYLKEVILPVIILVLFVIFIKPFIVMAIMKVLGYKKRVGFFLGMTMSQISEFSIIFVALGVSNGVLSSNMLSLITIVGIATITISSYLISYSELFYQKLSKHLLIFDNKNGKDIKIKKQDYEVILFGCNRLGYDFLDLYESSKDKLLIVDFDPEIIKELEKDKFQCIYGDADDSEFISDLDLKSVKLIISTIPDLDSNSLIAEYTRKVNKNAIILARAQNIPDAFSLYEKGVSYVIMPHFLGSKYVTELVAEYGYDKGNYLKEKDKHIRHLGERVFLGHEHPKISRG